MYDGQEGASVVGQSSRKLKIRSPNQKNFLRSADGVLGLGYNFGVLHEIETDDFHAK